MKHPSAESTPRRTGSPLLFGLVAVWGVVLIGSLLAAFLLRYASVDEGYLPYFTFGINGVALLGGGWISGRRAGEKGWLYGGSVGCLYALIVILIGFLAFDAAMQIHPLAFAAGAFALGALGGIFGVNTRGT
ncbi:MAG: TIGR04086 family membrane protein [Planifilum fimeticola]